MLCKYSIFTITVTERFQLSETRKAKQHWHCLTLKHNKLTCLTEQWLGNNRNRNFHVTPDNQLILNFVFVFDTYVEVTLKCYKYSPMKSMFKSLENIKILQSQKLFNPHSNNRHFRQMFTKVFFKISLCQIFFSSSKNSLLKACILIHKHLKFLLLHTTEFNEKS